MFSYSDYAIAERIDSIVIQIKTFDRLVSLMHQQSIQSDVSFAAVAAVVCRLLCFCCCCCHCRYMFVSRMTMNKWDIAKLNEYPLYSWWNEHNSTTEKRAVNNKISTRKRIHGAKTNKRRKVENIVVCVCVRARVFSLFLQFFIRCYLVFEREFEWVCMHVCVWVYLIYWITELNVEKSRG